MSPSTADSPVPRDERHAPASGASVIAAVASVPAAVADAEPARFRSIDPARGVPAGPPIAAATARQVELACAAAWSAYEADAARPPDQRAALLDAIASNLVELGDSLIQQACRETGLAPPRISTERDRTVFQLRMFADHVRAGAWVEAVIDHGNPGRSPLPKPDLRRMLRPLGPVAVFGASNFPLAYSVAGGDTASALAAGCPVIVKGHSAHPLTGELVAQAVADAVRRCGLDTGTFAFLHAGGARDLDVGRELVLHPRVRAVGFTGSVAGGTALLDLAARRTGPHGPDPIPVFAEMGSVNPVIVLPGAIESDAEGIGAKLAASAVSSSGQMCTCPGLVVLINAGAATARFIAALAGGMAAAGEMTLLTPRTRELLRHRRAAVSAATGVRLVSDSAAASPGAAGNPAGGDGAERISTHATLYEVGGREFARQPQLAEECFGPSTIVVRCESEAELTDLLQSHLPGSLTGSIFAAPADRSLAERAGNLLQRRVGRLVYNGVPTGVEVSPAMVHSGPHPACSRPDSSAVGPSAIRRWCRPVCYQNVPDELLPPELRHANPRRIVRIVDGEARP